MSALSGLLAEAQRELELKWAQEDEQELELTEAEKYARDPIAWLDSGHVWIATRFGPQGEQLRKLRPVRMRPFPDQRRTVEAWIDLPHLAKTGELVFRNEAIEKSRQIGETWIFASVICWAVHYHTIVGLCMHVDGGEIDDGGERSTVKSLFGKVRYIDQRLDRSLVPGLGKLIFRPFSRGPAKIENPARSSVVYGEGQTDDPGRGGTFDFVLVDEAAFVQHGEKVYAAIDEACPNGKALLSTVNGDDNFHARITDTKPHGWTILRLHWSQHPVYSVGAHIAGEDPDCLLCEGNRENVRWDATKPAAHRYPGRITSPWYDQRVIGKTDEQVAQELDIDRGRALSGKVYSEFSTDVHVETFIPFDPALMHATELAFDYGLDVTSVVICQDHPAEYRVVGELEMGDVYGTTASPELVAARLKQLLLDLGWPAKFMTDDWTNRIKAVGDPSGDGRSVATGRTTVAEYAKDGFQIGRPGRRWAGPGIPVDYSIKAVKRLLLGSPKPLRVSEQSCPNFILHMRNNVWPTDGSGRRRVGATVPLDNVHNHMMRAFAYLIVAKWPPPTRGTATGHDDPDEEIPQDPLERRRQRAVYGDRLEPARPIGYNAVL